MPFALLKYGLSSKYPAKRHFPKATGAEARLRRRHHRRRRPWPRRRLLPGQGLGHHQCRGARQGLSRRRQHRAQHGDHPLELPDAGGRALLRRIGPALSGAERGFRLQHPLFRARPFHARPYRCRHAHQPLARRGEQASGRRFRADLSRRHPPALPGAQHVGGCALSRSWARSIIRRAPSPATTPSPGAMPATPPSAASEIHTQTEVTGFIIEKGRVTGVETNRGHIALRQGAAGASPAPAAAVARHGGLPPADPHHPAAGLRLGAAEAVPRPDRRLRLAARLCLAVRARRAGDGRLDRSLCASIRRARPSISRKACWATCWSCSPSWATSSCCANGPAWPT